MKVIVKKPFELGYVCEVETVQEINEIVHNVNSDGTGYSFFGSDIRMPIGKGVDLYCKEDAVFNTAFKGNVWAPGDNLLICGNVLFAGYDPHNSATYGACSLTDEQIEYVQTFIARQAN